MVVYGCKEPDCKHSWWLFWVRLGFLCGDSGDWAGVGWVELGYPLVGLGSGVADSAEGLAEARGVDLTPAFFLAAEGVDVVYYYAVGLGAGGDDAQLGPEREAVGYGEGPGVGASVLRGYVVGVEVEEDGLVGVTAADLWEDERGVALVADGCRVAQQFSAAVEAGWLQLDGVDNLEQLQQQTRGGGFEGAGLDGYATLESGGQFTESVQGHSGHCLGLPLERRNVGLGRGSCGSA